MVAVGLAGGIFVVAFFVSDPEELGLDCDVGWDHVFCVLALVTVNRVVRQLGIWLLGVDGWIYLAALP